MKTELTSTAERKKVAFDYRVRSDGALAAIRSVAADDGAEVTINGATIAYMQPATGGETLVVFVGGARLRITESYETVHKALGFRE